MIKLLPLILCCSLALPAGAQKPSALRIEEILQREAIADTFHTGLTCTYKLAGSKQEAFAFAVRDNSALVRINGKDCWLSYVSSKNEADGAVFLLRYKNAQYEVVLRLRRMRDDAGNKGIMTVTDLISHRKVSAPVEGGCEA